MNNDVTGERYRTYTASGPKAGGNPTKKPGGRECSAGFGEVFIEDVRTVYIIIEGCEYSANPVILLVSSMLAKIEALPLILTRDTRSMFCLSMRTHSGLPIPRRELGRSSSRD